MNPPTNSPLDPMDDLRAANELIKLKLELEHKMVIGDATELSPEIENEWLNHIYNFEKLHKECKQAKVYDLLGRPAFAKYDQLSEEQVREELERLTKLMEEKSIALDCCCEYDAVIIYRFITEELFEYETDDFVMEGMVRHLIYEEFHPNHDYDLRRYSTRFIESVLSRKWNEQFDTLMLAEPISFLGKEHTAVRISSIVLAFQEAHTALEIEKIEIESVTRDVDKNQAVVEVRLAYRAHPQQGEARMFSGKSIVCFVYENDDWSISAFEFPGFGD